VVIEIITENGDAITMSKPATAETPAELSATLNALVKRCNSRDEAAFGELRKFLDANPVVWQTVGDLSRLAENALLERLDSSSRASQEVVRRFHAKLRAELAGEHPTATEKLLVELVVLSRISLLQATIAAAPHESNLKVAEARLRRVEAEQRRYLQAVRTLTTLRALMPKGLLPADAIKLFATPEKRKLA
jgi:hypothetical protein